MRAYADVNEGAFFDASLDEIPNELQSFLLKATADMSPDVMGCLENDNVIKRVQ